MAGKNIPWRRAIFWLAASLFLCSEALGAKEDVPFEVGEKLTYHLRWGVIPVGRARLWVRNVVDFGGKKAYHVSAEGKSNPFLSALFPVDDFVQSFWDVENLYSLGYQKIQNEGRYHINEIYLFDHDARRVTWFKTRRHKKKTFDMPSGVQDALSCLYEFRRRELVPKSFVEMDVHQDEKNYKVKVVTAEKEKLRVPALGKVEAVCVQPQAQHEGMFLRKGQMWIWFTDDEKRIPVKVQVKAPIFGRLTADLESIEKELEPEPPAMASEILEMADTKETNAH